MPRQTSQQPTEVVLQILAVLWERGPSTVREVHDSLQNRATGYSTTLKMMQVMHQKGVLKRDDSVRPQMHRPSRSQTRTQQGMVDHLISRAFGGAAGRMLVQALSSAKVSDEELAEIKALIEQMEEERS